MKYPRIKVYYLLIMLLTVVSCGGDPAEKWAERNRCPENDRLCEEAVWFMQNMFLGPRTDMDEIAEAIRKIRVHAPALARV